MKKLALFAGSDYYPDGGWKDFKASGNTKEELYEHIARSTCKYDWWHIVNLETGEIVDSK